MPVLPPPPEDAHGDQPGFQTATTVQLLQNC